MRPATDHESLVYFEPPMVRRQRQRVDERVRPYADTPDQGPGADLLAACHTQTLRSRVLDRLPEIDLDSTLAQHPLGGRRHPRTESGKEPIGEVGEDPPHPLLAEGRKLTNQACREQLALRGDLGARVAGSDDDEGAPRLAFGGVVGHRRELELPG